MSQGKFEKKPVEKRQKETGSVQPEKPAKKGKLWVKILIAVIVVILVLAVAAFATVNHYLNKLGSFDDPDQTMDTTPITDEFDTDSTIAGQETIETMDPTDVTFDEVEALASDDIVNIMLIGQDVRPGEGRSRSDTMLLVTLNPGKNAIQMTSFMRDTYVQIPGYLDNRLNVAYRYGGTDLMNATFLKNFGIEIDGNVMVDFTEFAHIIDQLGGVDIDLSAEETDYMIDRGCTVTQGMNHLNGEDALTFVRMRYVSGGDYGRTERQRRVITSLIDSFRDASLKEILALVDELLPRVVTNVSNTDILKYAATGVSLLADKAEVQSLRIPADDAHYGTMIDGMSVLVPDLKMCREDLEEFIYSTPAE